MITLKPHASVFTHSIVEPFQKAHQMTNKTTYYYVSPPDFLMKTTDYVIMILGIYDGAKIREIAQTIEKRFQTSDIIFYYNDQKPLNEKTMAWIRTLVTSADLVITDISEISREELMISVFAEINKDIPSLYVSQTQTGEMYDIYKSYDIAPLDYTEIGNVAFRILDPDLDQE